MDSRRAALAAIDDYSSELEAPVSVKPLRASELSAERWSNTFAWLDDAGSAVTASIRSGTSQAHHLPAAHLVGPTESPSPKKLESVSAQKKGLVEGTPCTGAVVEHASPYQAAGMPGYRRRQLLESHESEALNLEIAMRDEAITRLEGEKQRAVEEAHALHVQLRQHTLDTAGSGLCGQSTHRGQVGVASDENHNDRGWCGGIGAASDRPTVHRRQQLLLSHGKASMGRGEQASELSANTERPGIAERLEKLRMKCYPPEQHREQLGTNSWFEDLVHRQPPQCSLNTASVPSPTPRHPTTTVKWHGVSVADFCR